MMKDNEILIKKIVIKKFKLDKNNLFLHSSVISNNKKVLKYRKQQKGIELLYTEILDLRDKVVEDDIKAILNSTIPKAILKAHILEKQKKREGIPSDELYMATIFYKNILDADISKIENIMLQSENYSAMACFVSNVPGAHIEKFEQVVLATGRVRVLRQWKELVEFVSPRFDRKLEELEHDFNKNINFLKNWMEHNEETDERWQTVERISSEILSSKKAEQPAKPSRQKLFPFWKRK